MHQISYAGNTLVTGSAIAHSLLGYAQALADESASATVTIPVVHEDGTVVSAEILIGPASQLVAESYESAGPELEDAEVVEYLNAAAARLRPARAVAEDPADGSAVDLNGWIGDLPVTS
jgi:hypothetical protein